MPTVKPLADVAKQPKATPAKETVTVTAADVGTVNAAQIVDVKPAAPAAPAALQPLGARVPSFLKKFVPPTMAGNANNTPAYVGFASDSSANWPAMEAAKLDVGEPFVCVNGQYLKSENGVLRFWLAAAESFMSVVDQSYNYLYITRNMRMERVVLKQPTGKTRTFDTGPGGIQEHYLAYLFVLINGEIVPAKGDFMGTKSGAVASAVSAVRAAGSPDSGWLELSDAHRVTGSCPLPFGRVMCSMRTVPKLGKASGQTYHRGLCHCAPATMDEMSLLLRSLGADTFVQSTEAVHTSYLDRIKFYDETAAKIRPNVVEEKETDSPVS